MASMPRRLIIGILILLIIGVIGGTIFFVVQRLRGGAQPETVTPTTPGLQEAGVGQQQQVVTTADSDNDGLPDSQEVIWGTDVNNADTDGDGFLDGEEVNANHNPTIPAPNDLLPEGFTPGQTVSPGQPLQAERFFEDNLDLTGTSANLTEVYRSQFPEDQRTNENLAQFVETQPIITSLPRVRQEAVKITQADSPFTVQRYYSEFGSVENIVNQNLMTQAIFDDLLKNNNPDYVLGIVTQLRIYQEKLINAEVPPTANEVHQLTIGYIELLIATLEQISHYNEDPVKALVGINQLNTIFDTYTPIIHDEYLRLEDLDKQLNPPAPL